MSNLRYRLGRRLARLPYVARARAERADLSAFQGRPSLRLVIGVGPIVLSFVICWPMISLCGILAVWWSDPRIVLIGGPAFYGLSWGVWSLGMLIAGFESAHYGNLFFRWLTRVGVERLLAHGLDAADDTPPVDEDSPADG